MFNKLRASTNTYTLSLHDALPISVVEEARAPVHPAAHVEVDEIEVGERRDRVQRRDETPIPEHVAHVDRSEEHTSELQSRLHLVCRLLLEKKNRSSSTLGNHRSLS